MKTNEDLQRDVQNAIKWEPLLRAAEIGVTTDNGIVTQLGTVDSYSKKLEAEEAAKNVTGVTAVVENIKVDFGNSNKKSDGEITKEILNAFSWNWEIPKDKINIIVENGWVKLEGELNWNYQKELAKKAVKNTVGVIGITNNLIIKSEANDEIEKKDILQALVRNWSTDDQNIHVNVAGNKVILNGTVESLYQKEEAERIAWNAPGVWLVENELVIENDN